MKEPPNDTRALSRGKALQAWGKEPPERYFADWERLDCSSRGPFSLLNPFQANPDGFDHWLKAASQNGE